MCQAQLSWSAGASKAIWKGVFIKLSRGEVCTCVSDIYQKIISVKKTVNYDIERDLLPSSAQAPT